MLPGCVQHLYEYFYVFTASDNFCPTAGTTFKSITVVFSGPKIVQNGDTLTATGPFNNFQWYYNGVPIASATDSIFIATNNGYYSVSALTYSGCQMVSQIVLRTSSVGIENNNASEFKLSINPNPVINNAFNLLIESPEAGNALLRLFDVNGKTVYQNNIKITNGAQHLLIQPGILSSGVYQLKVIAGENVMEKK